MDWIDIALRRLRGAREQACAPESRSEALLPRFTPDGAWAAPPPRLRPSLVPAGERDAHVRRAIDALPELYRVAFLLCDVEGLAKEEAAALLDIPTRALALRLHRARQALVTLLARDLGPPLH